MALTLPRKDRVFPTRSSDHLGRWTRADGAYNVVNHDTEPLSAMWAMYPLLRVPRGARLAGLLTRFRVDWAGRAALERGAEVVPNAVTVSGGCTLDLTTAPTDRLRVATKLFGNWPERAVTVETYTGWLAIGADEGIKDLGSWINHDGWPRACSGLFDVAIEPGIGNADDLGRAISAARAMVVKPGGRQSWTARLPVVRSDEPRPESRRLPR
jgi:hypothetical protein